MKEWIITNIGFEKFIVIYSYFVLIYSLISLCAYFFYYDNLIIRLVFGIGQIITLLGYIYLENLEKHNNNKKLE
ncbi:hypothetical protein [Acetoanaerobium noterae]|jgi:hypothetical protein|uniref:hypothetical protein n=1 Tax=Acetoanaerobium noterae TaxID=745369 RepID=UPI0032424F5F